MRRRLACLVLIVAVLLSSVSVGLGQSSINSTQGSTEREQYVSKVERAVQEVTTSRAYIKELETALQDAETQVAEMEGEGKVTGAQYEARVAEVKELRASLSALKEANKERVKQIGKMQAKITRLEGQVSFYRKVAGVFGLLAAGAAAVVLLK